METKHTHQTIEESFVLGLNGIFKQSFLFTQPFKSNIIVFGLGLGVIGSFIVLYAKVDNYLYINEVVNLIIQLLPGLLGFTIASYSFLIGFIPSKLMERISEPLLKYNTSLFQSISASLALNILFHAFILLVAFILKSDLYLQDKSQVLRLSNINYVEACNICGVFIVNIALFVAIAIVIQIIASSFNLSQIYHYDVNKYKLDNKKEKSNT